MNRALVGLALLAFATGCGGDKKPEPEAKPPRDTLTSSTSSGKGDGTPVEKPEGEKPVRPEVGTSTQNPRLVVSMGGALRDLTSNDVAERTASVAFIAEADVDPAVKESVVTGLVRRLGDSDPKVRTAAVGALSKWADASDVALVSGVLGRGENDIRHRGIEVLGNIGGPEAATAIAARLESAFDRELATATLKTLGGDAEAAVLPFAEDPDKYVRLAVVAVLHDVGSPANSAEPLFELTQDPEPDVAVNAAKALSAVESR